MDVCTLFCEYDRPLNLPRWVNNRLTAYNVAVNELGECTDVCVSVECCVDERVWLAFALGGDVE
jgi:hypothetical protein